MILDHFHDSFVLSLPFFWLLILESLVLLPQFINDCLVSNSMKPQEVRLRPVQQFAHVSRHVRDADLDDNEAEEYDMFCPDYYP